uniref:dual specificity mitogen-activated protein kinase kinase 7-like n=1 Tax=Myxine glutinosa TaxID=7769 RepID=UPI00358E9150
MATSSLEQKLSRLQAKLNQERRHPAPRIPLPLDKPDTSPIGAFRPSKPAVSLTLHRPLSGPEGEDKQDKDEGLFTLSLPLRGKEVPPPPPIRQRQCLALLPHPQFPAPRSLESLELDAKLQEVMRQTGYLTLDGKKYRVAFSDLESLGEMGSGSCGQVWRMRFPPTQQLLAVKQMRRSGNREENKRILMDLDVVLKSHDCPYIVRSFGSFITGTDVFIVMELMDSCAEKLKKRIRGPIPERILGKMAVAILHALHYLKERHGVIHRDVKPSNFLLDSLGRVKLCDFGISGRLVDSRARTRGAGCAAYMAPERIDPPDPSRPDYDIRADVWSLGISMVELATGEFPYLGCHTDFEVLTRVLQEEPPALPLSLPCSPDFRSFVSDCLIKDHRKRPKYQKLLEHNFIRHYKEADVDVGAWYREVVATTELR